MKTLRNNRWDKAFKSQERVANLVDSCSRDSVNRKATIILEHLIQVCFCICDRSCPDMEAMMELILRCLHFSTSARPLILRIQCNTGTSTANGMSSFLWRTCLPSKFFFFTFCLGFSMLLPLKIFFVAAVPVGQKRTQVTTGTKGRSGSLIFTVRSRIDRRFSVNLATPASQNIVCLQSFHWL